MIITTLWLGVAAVQGTRPTVGDTLWVRHAVALPAGFTARAAAWEPEGDIELLGRPELELRSDSAIVRYPLVAWTAGRHVVEVPSPTLLAPDGDIDSLPSRRVTLDVASVLPDRPPSDIPPQPGAGVVVRPAVSFLPLLLLGAVALLALLPLHWWWRRRGRPLPSPAGPESTPVPIERWAEAGEARSVLALASARLRGALRSADPDLHEGLDTAACVALVEERHPTWPVREIAESLRRIDTTRFAPDGTSDPMALYRAADALAARLERSA